MLNENDVTVNNLDDKFFEAEGENIRADLNSGRQETGQEGAVEDTNEAPKGDDEFGYLDAAEEPSHAEDVDNADEQDEDEDEPEVAPKGKKSKGYYAAINKRNRERDRQALLQLQRENAELKGKFAVLESYTKKTEQPDLTPEEEQAQAALRFLDERDAEKEAKRQQQMREEAERIAYEKRQKVWDRELKDAARKYSDFNEIVMDNDDIMGDSMLHAAVQIFENRVDILRHLGRNPDALDRIQSLDGIEKAQALAVLSNKIAARQAAKRHTGAPPSMKFNGRETKSSGYRNLGALNPDEIQNRAEKERW